MRLTELLELTELPEGTEALLEGETLSPEEEDRVLAKALTKAGLTLPPRQKGDKTMMKRSKFGLMLLAGVVCAGAVVASAAGYFAINHRLARHLNAGEKENGLVSQGVQDLSASCTAEGWTLTADQVLGDRNQIRVLFELTAPEGTVLGEGNYRFELPILNPDVTFTIDTIEDDNPTDNKLSFVLNSIEAKDYRGSMVDFHMEGLSRYKPYAAEEIEAGANPLEVDRLVTADFDLSFRLDYQDTSVTYQPGAEVDTPYGKIRVDEVVLSPLSVLIKLSGKGTVLEPGTQLVLNGEVSAFQVDDKGNIIKVDPQEVESEEHFFFNGDEEHSSMMLFHDGSTLQSQYGVAVQVLDRAGKVIPYQTGDTAPESVSMTFRGIVDPADVAAIRINNVEVPLTR